MGYSGTTSCKKCGCSFPYANYDCVPDLCKDCYVDKKVASHSRGNLSGTTTCSGCRGKFSYSNYDCVPSLCKTCYGNRAVSRHKTY